MPSLARPPCSALAPWVQLVWSTAGNTVANDLGSCPVPYIERVLPTGALHVVLRLDGSPLALFEGAGGSARHVVGHSVVGGARASSYVKRAGDSGCSVGVQLKPGASLALLGWPGAALAERHTALDALWGREADLLREQLWAVHERALLASHGAVSLGAVLHAQLAHFESYLLARARSHHLRVEPWLTRAVAALEAGAPLADIVDASGVSHRAFITRFRTAVGLTPKVFARVRRFQRTVQMLSSEPLTSTAIALCAEGARPRSARSRLSLAHVALDAGYADQAHLSRDFVEFAGLTPSAYLRLAPEAANHVRVRL